MLRHVHPVAGLRWMKALAFASLVIGPLANSAWAEEPAEAFLKGLRERRYHDMALEYLDGLAENEAVSDEVKETIVYERGLTLVDQSRYERDPSLRARMIERAEESFQEFLENHPNHRLAANASTQLGNVLVEQARFRVRKAESGRGNEEALYREAREYFDRAHEVFTSRKAIVRTELEEIGQNVDPNDAELIEHRNSLRAEYVQVQLLAANNLYEKAGTFEAGSDEKEELLTEAADAFREIYERYRTRMAGLYAQLYRGHCYKDLEDFENAILFYQELLMQEDNPVFRPLQIKALRASMECWMHESVNQLDLAINSASKAVETMRRHESQDPDWIALRYYLALAYKMKGDELLEEEGDARLRDQAYRNAKIRARELSRLNNDFQELAQELLSELTGIDLEESNGDDPTTFVEARDAGKDALDLSESGGVQIRILKERMGHLAPDDTDAREAMQDAIVEAEKTSVENRYEARRFFRMALEFANEDTSLDEVNTIRYYLCYVFYKIAATEGGDSDAFYDAAVIGEFLSTRYPEANGARQSANIAMESYKAIFRTAPDDDNEFEIAGILRTAEFIATMWPDMPEAEQALDSLVTFMVRIGRIEEAETYLNQIDENSPRRGQAELKVGNQLWRNYRRGSRERREAENEGTADPNLPSVEELAMLRQKAAEMLALGVGRFDTGEVDGNLADAMVTLTEVSVENGEIERAIGYLENEDHGLLKLLLEKHPATQRTFFDTMVYKVAIRAYIASVPDAPNEEARQERLNGAGAMMDALKDAMGETPERKRQLLSIYLSLASDIQDQLNAEPEESKRIALAQAFHTFLLRIAQSPEAEIREQLWVGEAYRSLGESFDDNSDTVSENARRYYERSVATFRGLLRTAPEAQKPQILIRLAQTQRKLRMYEEAVEAYVGILRGNPNMLNVQIDAAQTLEEWGVHSQDKSKLIDAIIGSHPVGDDDKNIIWGWAKLQRVTGQNRGYRFIDEFYHARYRLGSCRFYIGNMSDAPERNQSYDRAIREILSVYSLFLKPGMESDNPALHDPTNDWYDRFETLLKGIQQGRRVRQTGFSASNSLNTEPFIVANTVTLDRFSVPPTDTPSRSLLIAAVLGLVVIAVSVAVLACSGGSDWVFPWKRSRSHSF